MAGLGLIGTVAAGALEGLGRSAGPLAEYVSRSALAQQAEEAQKLRDARLEEFQRARDERLHAQNVSIEKEVRQPFQSSERAAGEKFQTSMEKEVRQPFQREQEERRIGAAESLQEAQQIFQREQNEEQRKLTREQIASQERVSSRNNAVALEVAKIGGTVQSDKEGKLYFMGKDGTTKPVMDPNDPEKQLVGFKDLTPAAKAYVDTIKAQLVELDRAEAGAVGDAAQLAQIASRRTALTREQLNVLTGGISEAGTPAPAPRAAPKAGEVVNGFKFKGGDPKNQANWTPATEAAPKKAEPAERPARGLLESARSPESSVSDAMARRQKIIDDLTVRFPPVDVDEPTGGGGRPSGTKRVRRDSPNVAKAKDFRYVDDLEKWYNALPSE